MFYIEYKNIFGIFKRKDNWFETDTPKTVYVGKNFERMLINGCSGTKGDVGFESRKEATKYILKHPIKFLFGLLVKEIYFYGGCGCCGIQYEDYYTGEIKDVSWPQFFTDKKDILSNKYTEDNFKTDMHKYRNYLVTNVNKYMDMRDYENFYHYKNEFEKISQLDFGAYKEKYFGIES